MNLNVHRPNFCKKQGYIHNGHLKLENNKATVWVPNAPKLCAV